MARAAAGTSSGRAPACSQEQRRAAKRADQPLGVGFADGRECDRHVAENLGVEPAHPDERNRPEARIAPAPDDQLDPVLDRRRPLDGVLLEHPMLPCSDNCRSRAPRRARPTATPPASDLCRCPSALSTTG